MADELREIAPKRWREAAQAARDQGWVWFDHLGAVDELGREDVIRLLLRIAATPDTDGLQLQTRIPRDEPVLDSVRNLWAGAAWHEREIRDFFGVAFAGGDNRPLLLRPDTVGHPLRKDHVLAARVVREWPGNKDADEGAAGARRRMVPPGVPDPEVWGDRHGEPASPAEIAASLAGGRVRRRR
ncbi:MAG: NADH-quinone oxidoreductase subunit C [Propioniciclava sp.]